MLRAGLLHVLFLATALMLMDVAVRADDSTNTTSAPTAGQVQSVLKIVVADAPKQFAALKKGSAVISEGLWVVKSTSSICPHCDVMVWAPGAVEDDPYGSAILFFKSDAFAPTQALKDLIAPALGPSFVYAGVMKIDDQPVPTLTWKGPHVLVLADYGVRGVTIQVIRQ